VYIIMSIEPCKIISETNLDIRSSCENFFESQVMMLVMKNKISELTGLFDGPEHLNTKYEVTQRSYFGKTALEMACLLGRTKMLQLFANNEINLDGLNENGYALSHLAAGWGRIDSLRTLDQCSPVDIEWTLKNSLGETPIAMARRYKQEECILFVQKAIAKSKLKQSVLRMRDILTDSDILLSIKMSKEEKSAWNSSCKIVVFMLNETFEWLPDCLEDSVEISQIEKKRKCCEQAYKSLLEKFNLPTDYQKKASQSAPNSRKTSAATRRTKTASSPSKR